MKGHNTHNMTNNVVHHGKMTQLKINMFITPEFIEISFIQTYDDFFYTSLNADNKIILFMIQNSGPATAEKHGSQMIPFYFIELSGCVAPIY